MKNKQKQFNRKRRHKRVRAKIMGTKERPRVSVFKSNRHIFVQFIDDRSGKTIFSSKVVSAKKSKIKGSKAEKSSEIGKIVAEKAKASGIKEAVFDRGGYKYHGRIRALAEGLRAGGVKF